MTARFLIALALVSSPRTTVTHFLQPTSPADLCAQLTPRYRKELDGSTGRASRPSGRTRRRPRSSSSACARRARRRRRRCGTRSGTGATTSAYTARALQRALADRRRQAPDLTSSVEFRLVAIAREAEPGGVADGGERGGPRPRGPPHDLPQHADHARGRGARPHPLQAGQDPRLVLHRARERGRGRRRRDRDGARRRRPRRSTATWASTSPAGSSPGGSSPSTWAAPTGRRKGKDGNVHIGRHAPRDDRDGQPPAGDAAGRGRRRARVPDPRGAARRGRLVRRGRRPRAATRTRR